MFINVYKTRVLQGFNKKSLILKNKHNNTNLQTLY